MIYDGILLHDCSDKYRLQGWNIALENLGF